MKITQKESVKKQIIITSTIILLLLIGGVIFAKITHLGPFSSPSKPSVVDLNPATADQKNAGNTAKQNSPDNRSTSPNTDTPPAPTNSTDGSKGVVGVTITAANQTNSTLQVRTLIDTVTNDGTCTITLEGQSGNPITQNVDVQPQSSTSTCKGFDIPLSELPPGEWKIKIIYTSSSLTGSATKTITIKTQ